MSRFRRSGHYRTNAYGTTFWVGEHNVSRDDWAHGEGSRPREFMSAPGGTQYGITYPNARCPKCHERVFFFAAHNGGRVFFDPPLGPPWDKHPCTILKSDLVSQIPYSEQPVAAVPLQESFSYEVYPLSSGSVIVADIDGEEKAYSTGYEFTRPHLNRVWPIRNSRGTIVGLSLLTSDFEPVEIQVRARRLPGPMSLSTRVKLASNALERVPALVARISSAVIGSIETVSTTASAYAIAKFPDGDAVFVPVPIDHKANTLEEECETIRRYMFDTAKEGLEALRRPVPDGSYLKPKDRIVFCFDDILGQVSGHIAGEIGFSYDGLLDTDEFWRHPKPWLKSLEARVVWADFLSDDPLSLPDGGITVEEAFEIEGHFCAGIWPNNGIGRRQKIDAMTGKVGLAKEFQLLIDGLRERNWLLNFKGEYGVPFTHELEFAWAKSNADSARHRVRVLLSLSSSEIGLALVGGWSDESAPVADALWHIKTKDQLTSLLITLEQSD